MSLLTGSRELTMVDLADRLLDTGVSLTGDATISVADVDLVYLGLSIALMSVERAEGRPRKAARSPVGRASGSLARNVPDGPGAMRAQPEEVRADLPERIDVDPDDVERGLAKLVLTIVEFVRQILERQAIRRMEAGSLTEAEVERVGVALMRLEEKVGEMAGRFGIERKDLTLRLGPLGDLV